MTPTDPGPNSPTTRGVLILRRLLTPLGPLFLRRRLARGREDPDRWREKLGHPGLARPPGRLVWLHGVGLGEVLALRGLAAALAAAPDVRVLITSSTLGSAKAVAGQLPPGILHQFLPLDLPGPVRRFLDHWKPDLSVWAEQDLWPGFVLEAARRGVPMAMVNARMDARAAAGRRRAGRLYRDLYARFSLIAAQDERTAANLRGLGAAAVSVTGPLKPGAGALACDMAALARARAATAGRRPWLAATTHAADEALAFAAAARVPHRLLVVAPRYPRRGAEVAAAAAAAGLAATRRSLGQGPDGNVWVADTLGEMGLWYRLCDRALIGGQGVGGHNPWEAAALGCAVLHGPDVANFAGDYARLAAAGAAREVATAEALAAALEADLAAETAAAAALCARSVEDTARLAAELLGLMR